jgi:hypothetical protein
MSTITSLTYAGGAGIAFEFFEPANGATGQDCARIATPFPTCQIG